MSVAPSEVKGTPQFRDFFLSLKGEDEMYGIIRKAIDTLRANMLAGKKIEKKKWPKFYVKRYGITNLFVYKLGKGWRLTYTIIAEGVKKIVVVLEAMDHKTYERRFGY